VQCPEESVKAKPINLIWKQRPEPEIVKEAAMPEKKKKTATTTTGVYSKWSKGLSAQEQYRFLTHSYQLRCDDEYTSTGTLRGPYDPDVTLESLVQDFLTFCILAQRHAVLPTNWDWSAFLDVASLQVPFAYEMSDARDDWGWDSARILPPLAAIVYGSECSMLMESSRAELEVSARVCVQSRKLQKSVGGVKVWKKFEANVARCDRFF